MPIWIHTLNYMAIYVEIHTHTLPPRHFLGPVVLAVYGKWIPFSIFEQTAISLLSQWRIEWERIVWNTPNTNRLQLIWAHELHSFACSLHRRLIYIFTMIIIIISTHMYTTHSMHCKYSLFRYSDKSQSARMYEGAIQRVLWYGARGCCWILILLPITIQNGKPFSIFLASIRFNNPIYCIVFYKHCI